MSRIRSAIALLTSVLISSPATAEDLEFVLINSSEYTLVEFYTSPADVGSWEEDVLGNDVLGSGYSLNITVADGRTQCIYDMLMIFEDGDRLEDQVDLCEMGSYTIE